MSDPKIKPSTNHCLCTGCGEYFTTPRNFDKHRVWTMPPEGVKRKASDVRCVDPGSLVDKHGKARLHRNAKGLWASVGGAYVRAPS